MARLGCGEADLPGTIANQQASILLNDVNDEDFAILERPKSTLQLGTVKMQGGVQTSAMDQGGKEQIQLFSVVVTQVRPELSTCGVESAEEIAIDLGEVLVGAARDIRRKDDMIENAPKQFGIHDLSRRACFGVKVAC